MRGALVLPLVLAACVQSGPSAAESPVGTPFQIGKSVVVATQMSDWPSMIYAVDASGQSQIMQNGTAPTVIISGAPDFDTAVDALGQFCGRAIDPMGFDTQFVFKEPASGDYWFDGHAHGPCLRGLCRAIGKR
ncbi:MAG: hypothetical protein NTW20_01430 [Rhodobacterales bacterium]|nr:hypothetical protein [Rhodobacterales bacterium]